jgi:polyisoprenoid-binding protein YceI
MLPRRTLFGLMVALALAGLPGPAWAQMQRWSVEAGQSRIGFDAFHVLGAFSAASERPSGEFEANISDLKQPVKGTLTVAAATLRSGDSGRDRDIRAALDAEHHPDLQYRIDKVESSFPSLAENNDVLLTIHGVLSLRGVDRPVTFTGRVRLRQGGTLWVRGESWIKPRDFGIPPLRQWMLSIRESVLATFDLVMSRAQ